MGRSRGSFDVVGQLAALRRYAMFLTREETEAEDLVHDVLVLAYEKQKTFRPDGNLRAWLLAILHNEFVSGLRRKRMEANGIRRVAEMRDRLCPPGQEMSVHLAQVQKAFLMLPEEQRNALHLVTIEGLTYQDAADVLNIPVGTLMSRLARARSALRALEEPWEGAGRSQASGLHLHIVRK